MERSSVVLKSISCRGVRTSALFQKPSAYAVVSISTSGDRIEKEKKQRQKTPIDHAGGENPEWDQTFRFDLDDEDFRDLYLEFSIKSLGSLLFGDKVIGESRVPIVQLSEGYLSGVVRHVSYQVHSPNGKPNGFLNFSCSLNLPGTDTHISSPLVPEIPSPPLILPLTSLSASASRESLYPSISLSETEQDDLYSYQNHPLDLPKYYPPPPDPDEYYLSTRDRAVYPPLLTQDAYTSSPIVANVCYYSQPQTSLPPQNPAYGTISTYHPTFPTSAPSYLYPPSEDLCRHCNCR